jgi:hypothetical protein
MRKMLTGKFDEAQKLNAGRPERIVGGTSWRDILGGLSSMSVE